MEQIETIVVGGGQAGLATSYHLKQLGMKHLVLEQSERAAPVWRDGRWDSFSLVTPNRALRMPGAEYGGPDPDAFMPRDQVISYFDQYVDRFELPVQCNTRVVLIEEAPGGFRVETQDMAYRANNVVVATGFEQSPEIPQAGAGLSSEIVQLHSSQYRNPQTLPEGAVLVVGSAQSGAQIAEELYQSGRKVYLSTSNAGRAPRRYRNKDIFAWLLEIGFLEIPADKFPVPKEEFTPPHVSGKNGGHTLNLHQFCSDGVTLLGHFRGASGTEIEFAPDLYETLGRSDGFEKQVMKMVDDYVAATGIDAPLDELPELRNGYDQQIVEKLDARSAGISSVVWATGYVHNYDLVKIPVFDSESFPVQQRGVTKKTGLFFVGMPWMPGIKSGTLAGVGESAQHVVSELSRVYA